MTPTTTIEGDEMTPEQLRYVREWARRGNETRPAGDVMDMFQDGPEVVLSGVFGGRKLSPLSLLIAKIADALEQANETAESCQWCLMMDTTGRPHEQLTTMRANRLELLGR